MKTLHRLSAAILLPLACFAVAADPPRLVEPDGSYAQRQPGQGDDNRTVHEILIDLAHQRLAESSQMEGGAKKPASKSGGGRKRNVAHKAA